jgi:MerR family transcriptional regulator, light-induced transcriptional regulator
MNQKKDLSDYIRSNLDSLAIDILKQYFFKQKDLKKRCTKEEKQKCLQDIKNHLKFLSESIGIDSKLLFSNYMKWLNDSLAGRNISNKGLIVNLECIGEVFKSKISPDQFKSLNAHIIEGIEQLKSDDIQTKTFLDPQNELFAQANKYLEYLLGSKRNDASLFILDLAKNNVLPKNIYLGIFQPVQYEIGRLWQTNKISVAVEHYCTAVTQMVMSQLYPYIFSSKKNGKSFVATCASGELHELGIRMVADLLEMEGWDTYYLGANTPIEDLAQTIREQKPDVLGISATMTFHLEKVKEIISMIREDISSRVLKIIVGGYLFNISKGIYKKIGADAFAENAEEAIKVIKKIAD